METLRHINFALSVLFMACYAYQFLYIPVPWLKKAKPHAAPRANRYAVLICARNEAAVIGDLIASIHSQTYDQSLISVFVMADNCTDDTALIARCAGAVCYERFNTEQVGQVESVTARRSAITRMESEWREACSGDVLRLPALPPGAVYCRRGKGYILALPWQQGEPFPLAERFCLARVGTMAGRSWVFYTVDGRGEPIS